jgi:hypothetical protein
MSPLPQEDRRANHVLRTSGQALILWATFYTLFAAGMMHAGQVFCGLKRAGVVGVSRIMALSNIFTSSPTQLHKIRGILRANRAPALVQEELAVA